LSRIDLDRGVVKRNHASGMQVVMYKDKPGVFYDNRGTLVSDALAADAGFNVEQLRREQKRQELLSNYSQQLHDQFAAEEQRLARQASEGLDTVEIRAVGKDYALFDRASGDRLTSVPLTLDGARDMAKLYSGIGGNDAGDSQDEPTETAEPKTQSAGATAAAGSKGGTAAESTPVAKAAAGKSLTD